MTPPKVAAIPLAGVLCLLTYAMVRNLMPDSGLKSYGGASFEDDGTPTMIAGGAGARAGGALLSGGLSADFTMDASTAEFFGGNFSFVSDTSGEDAAFSTAFAANNDRAYLENADSGYHFGTGTGGDGKEGKDVIGEGKESKDVIGEGGDLGGGGFSPGLTSVPLITLTNNPTTVSPPDEAPPNFDTPNVPETPDTPDVPDIPIPEPATALFGMAMAVVMGISRRRR